MTDSIFNMTKYFFNPYAVPYLVSGIINDAATGLPLQAPTVVNVLGVEENKITTGLGTFQSTFSTNEGALVFFLQNITPTQEKQVRLIPPFDSFFVTTEKRTDPFTVFPPGELWEKDSEIFLVCAPP